MNSIAYDICQLLEKPLGITGASSVIGTATIRHAIDRNSSSRFQVTLRKPPLSGTLWERTVRDHSSRISFLSSPLLSFPILRQLVSGSRCLIHLALLGDTEEKTTLNSHRLSIVDNSIAHLFAAVASAQNNIPLVAASSYGVYLHLGLRTESSPLREEDLSLPPSLQLDIARFCTFLDSINPEMLECSYTDLRSRASSFIEAHNLFLNLTAAQSYSVHKLVLEHFVTVHPAAIALRIGNIYGPGDHATRPMPVLIQAVKRGGRINIPNESRSFIFVSDVAEAILRAGVLVSRSKPTKRIINVLTSQPISSRRVCERLSKMFDRPVEIITEGDDKWRDLRFSTACMESVLGMREHDLTVLEDGITQMFPGKIIHRK